MVRPWESRSRRGRSVPGAAVRGGASSRRGVPEEVRMGSECPLDMHGESREQCPAVLRRRGLVPTCGSPECYCVGVKRDDLAILSDRVVHGGRMAPATVVIRSGKIEEVRPGRTAAADARNLDVGNLVLMPGVVDVHVHVNEPGRTEWEGFRTAGRAAVAGGVTTMVVMPLNCSPVATGVEALMGEVEAATGVCACDFGLWGGVIPGNTGSLRAIWEAGALGFKCFLVHSGIDEFPNVTRRELEEAMPVLRSLGVDGGAVLLVHAEDPGAIEAARIPSGLEGDPRSYAKYLRSRPPQSEVKAIEMMVDLWRATGCRTHIVHVSSGDALPVISEAKRGASGFTAETCPHYLMFAAEDIPDGGTVFKCAPPIRERSQRESLWRGLESGALDLIASDHSPAPGDLKGLKDGNFAKAWGGISGLQVQLSAVWTGAHERGCSLVDLARWMSEAPATLAGIRDQKGTIAPGMDADLIVFDPEATWVVRGGELEHRHKATPYDGLTLRGKVHATFLRGKQVFSSDRVFGPVDALTDGFSAEANGRWVRRSRV